MVCKVKLCPAESTRRLPSLVLRYTYQVCKAPLAGSFLLVIDMAVSAANGMSHVGSAKNLSYNEGGSLKISRSSGIYDHGQCSRSATPRRSGQSIAIRFVEISAKECGK